MRLENDIKLDFKDVLFRPKRSVLTSRSEVDLVREFKFPNCPTATWKGVPIVAANMDTVGTFETAKALAKHRMLTCISKHYDVEKWMHKLNGYGVYKFPEQKEDAAWKHEPDSKCWQNRIYEHLSVSCGIKDDDLDYLRTIIREFYYIKFICIDAANGYTARFCDFIKKVRVEFPNHIIIAGNVVTGEMAEEIILSGADIVKVGIGSGSVCTTRVQTGVGYPQVSAVIECADAAHGVGGHVMSDGGCVCAGDVAKAFGAGADFVCDGLDA